MKRILILLLIITGLYIAFNKALEFDWFSASGMDLTAAVSGETNSIVINVPTGSTTIIPENRKDVKAVYTGTEKLYIKENGDKVEVTLKNKWFAWFNWNPFSKHNNVKIYVPENYDRNMNIHLGSGNLYFSGQSENRPYRLNKLTLDLGSGNMNLSNLEVNQFQHIGSSGNVKIDTLKTKAGSIDLSSGNLDIKHYSGAFHAKVASGKLALQVDRLTDTIGIDVSSGLVNVDLPSNGDFTLNGDIGSGKIFCQLPLKSEENNHGSLKGTHGDGKYKVNLSVSSGIVTIN